MPFAPFRFLTRQRVPTSALEFRDLRGETRTLLLYTAAYVGAAVLTGLTIRRWPMPLWGATDFLQDVSYAIVFKIGLLLVVPLAIHHEWGYRVRDLLHAPPPGLRSIFGIALAWTIGMLINESRLAGIREGIAAHPAPESYVRVAIGIALGFLQAGLPEEIVFRSMLQSRLEKRWGRALAIVITLVLFVAWHLPTRLLLAHGIEGQAGDVRSVLLGTGAPVAVVGLALGLGWDRWRNLPVLVALHAGIDTLPMVGSMLQVPPT